MREKLVEIAAMFILALCLWGHVSEMFDHWDNTFQTGNDVEYSTVIAVLVAGAVIAFARVALRVLRNVSITSDRLQTLASYAHLATSKAIDFICHSPPKPLRI
jgi:hypothetical protein